jgi:hypothetical protein
VSLDDVGCDGVVQRFDVVREERPMSLKGGFVASTGWACLSFPGVALQSTLGQAQHQVAQQGFGQASLFEEILGFGKHVVCKVVCHRRGHVCSRTLRS